MLPSWMRLSLGAAILFSGCSKNPNAPDAKSSVSGRWVSADTVDVFTGFDLQMVQDEKGFIGGSWTGKTRILNGKCDPEFGCNPSNSVSGSNLSLKVTIDILGAGTYVGQLSTRDVIQGKIIRFGIFYDLTLKRSN